jgi:hypothetical protein
MNRTLRNVAAAWAGALILTCAGTIEANAYYLGYGNGDPGNWDYWTEQHGGAQRSEQRPAKPVRHTYSQHHHGAAHVKHKDAEPNHS